ncbi:hypothetical protein M514_24604, partial [Trichuris suis]
MTRAVISAKSGQSCETHTSGTHIENRKTDAYMSSEERSSRNEEKQALRSRDEDHKQKKRTTEK